MASRLSFISLLPDTFNEINCCGEMALHIAASTKNARNYYKGQNALRLLINKTYDAYSRTPRHIAAAVGMHDEAILSSYTGDKNGTLNCTSQRIT